MSLERAATDRTALDRAALAAAVARHGRVARIVVAAAAGSTPRGVGTAMLVWAGGSEGTIGGGALELAAIGAAHAQLQDGTRRRLTRHPLGPALGQCCGGSVALLTELFDTAALQSVPPALPYARPAGPDAAMPLAVRRLVAAARTGAWPPVAQLVQGWFVEPVSLPRRAVWVWGAGHVGRAIVAVLSPLPDLSLTWIDTSADRFPQVIPDGVLPRVAPDPAALAGTAPTDAEHLIVTFSHALDLALCHALLSRGFAWAGLIGSSTKWARFRQRLRDLGHADAQILRIACPIGDPSLGKHPQAIALGVGAALLRMQRGNIAVGERQG